MVKKNCTKWIALVAISLSTCFANACTTGLRDAVMGGAFDFASGAVTETLGSFLVLPN